MKIRIIDGGLTIIMDGNISFADGCVIIKTDTSRELKRFPMANISHIDNSDTIFLK